MHNGKLKREEKQEKGTKEGKDWTDVVMRSRPFHVSGLAAASWLSEGCGWTLCNPSDISKHTKARFSLGFYLLKILQKGLMGRSKWEWYMEVQPGLQKHPSNISTESVFPISLSVLSVLRPDRWDKCQQKALLLLLDLQPKGLWSLHTSLTNLCHVLMA